MTLPAPRQEAPRALRIATDGLLALAIGLYAIRWLFELWDLDRTEYGEGPLLAFVHRWATEPISAGWLSEFPISLTAYGPTFAWIWKAAIAFTPTTDPLLVGRVLTGVCGVSLIVVVAIAVQRGSRHSTSSLLAILVVISSSIVVQFFAHARVDTMAGLCVALAYVILAPSAGRHVLTAVLLVVGSTIKQTAAAHIVPLALVSLFTCGPKSAGLLTATAVALGVPLWAGILTLGDGFFWTAAVKSNLNEMSVWQGHEILSRVVSTPNFILALIGGWLSAMTLGNRVLGDRWIVGFVWSFALAVAMGLKAGSSVNYFIDALWLGAIVAARAAGPFLSDKPSTSRLGICVGAGLALLQPLMILHAGDWHPEQDEPRLAVVRASVAPDAPVLADGHLIAHVERAKRRLLVNDPFLFRLLADDDPSLGMKAAAMLSDSTVVLLDSPLEARLQQDNLKRTWPSSVLETLSRQFCLTEIGPELYIYRSRSDPRCLRRP